MSNFKERVALYLAQGRELEALAGRSSTVEAKAELLGLAKQYRDLAAKLKRRIADP